MWNLALLNDFNFKLNGYKTINLLGTLDKCDSVTVLVRESLNIITVEKQVLKITNYYSLLLRWIMVYSFYFVFIDLPMMIRIFLSII